MSRAASRSTLRDLAQHVVADLVAEAVVDELEVVDVDHQQADRLGEAAGALDLVAQALLEATAVGQAR